MGTDGWRRFELRSGKSSKFWEVCREGASQRVRFGRIGSGGREQQKDFDSEAACVAAIERLVGEKLRKGYAEVGPGERPLQDPADPPRAGAAEEGPRFQVTVLGGVPEDAPVSVELRPPRAVKWGSEKIEPATSELTALGYRDVGHAQISGLPRFATRVLIHAQESIYAVLYDDTDAWLDLFSTFVADLPRPGWCATNARCPLIGLVAQRPLYFAGVQLPDLSPPLLHREFLATRPPAMPRPATPEAFAEDYLRIWELDARWQKEHLADAGDSDASRRVVLEAWERARAVRVRDPAEELHFLLADLYVDPKTHRLPESLSHAASRGDVEGIRLFVENGVGMDTLRVDHALKRAAGGRHREAFEVLARVALEKKILSEPTLALLRRPLDEPPKRSELAEKFEAFVSSTVLMGERPERAPLAPDARASTVQRALELASSSELAAALRDGRHAEGSYLSAAVATGEEELVAAVLAAGPPQAIVSEALIVAAGHRNPPLVEQLLAAGADPRFQEAEESTALISAASAGDPALVRRLLEAGADPLARFRAMGTAKGCAKGPFVGEIRELLDRAVKAQQRGPGSSVRFEKRKKTLDPAEARGAAAFQRKMGHPEWSILFVDAAPEDVARAYAEVHPDHRWEADCAGRRLELELPCFFAFRLRGNRWTTLLRTVGWIGLDDFRALREDAQRLSTRLRCRVLSYTAEDTSGCEQYDLYENGELRERASWDGELRFEGRRPEPPKLGEDFPELVFSELGIYLPACWADSDGHETKLVLERVRPESLERLDAFKPA